MAPLLYDPGARNGTIDNFRSYHYARPRIPVQRITNAHNPQLLITSKVIFSNGKRKRGMEAEAKVVINDMALELLMARCLPHSGNPLLKIS